MACDHRALQTQPWCRSDVPIVRVWCWQSNERAGYVTILSTMYANRTAQLGSHFAVRVVPGRKTTTPRAARHRSRAHHATIFCLLAVVPLVLVATEAFARNLPCDAFRRNLFGSWSTLRLATIQGPKGPIALRRGRTFRPGEHYKGLDLAALLEQQCRGRTLNDGSRQEVFPQNIPCRAFRRNLLGSWSTRRLVTVQGPAGPITLRRGRTLRAGEHYNGLDLATLLEQNCR